MFTNILHLGYTGHQLAVAYLFPDMQYNSAYRSGSQYALHVWYSGF